MKILILSLLLALSFSGHSIAANFKVVVHDNFPLEKIGVKDLRKIFLQKMKNISGKSILAVNLDAKHAVRAAFSNEVLRKDSSKLERYYLRRALSGKGAPPQALDSEEAVVSYIKSHPGAIGYIGSGSDSGGLRTLTLE